VALHNGCECLDGQEGVDAEIFWRKVARAALELAECFYVYTGDSGEDWSAKSRQAVEQVAEAINSADEAVGVIEFALQSVDELLTSDDEISLDFVRTVPLLEQMLELWRDADCPQRVHAHALEIATWVFSFDQHPENATAIAISDEMALLADWMLRSDKLESSTRARLEQIKGSLANRSAGVSNGADGGGAVGDGGAGEDQTTKAEGKNQL
jgi:hypothetical protein